MTLQKIAGCSEGYYLTIGRTQFAVLRAHTYKLDKHKKYQVEQAKEQSPQPGYNPGEINTAFVAYAFRPAGSDWVLSRNVNGSQLIGRLLNSITNSKSERIPYDEFYPLVQSAYMQALVEESAQSI